MSDATDGVAPAGDAPETSSSSESEQQDQRLVPESDLDSLRSTLQKQVSAAQQETQAARQEMDQHVRAADERAFQAQLASVPDPEDKAKLTLERTQEVGNQRVQTLERQVKEAQNDVDLLGREAAAKDAVAKYDLPEEMAASLINLPSPDAMLTQAGTIKQHIDATMTKGASSKPTETSEPTFDTGTGGGSSAPVDNSDLKNSGNVFEGFKRARVQVAQE